MLLNLVLLGVLFATAKKLNQYLAAAAFGVCKGVLVLLVFRQGANAILSAAIYAVMAGLFVFFMKRLDRYGPETPDYARSGPPPKRPFKWEYIPLSALMLLLIFT